MPHRARDTRRYTAPLASTYNAYSEWQLAMNSRFFFAPPNVKLAQRSGRRMKPIALPKGLKTMTPSRSSGLAEGEPLLPQPHHKLPSVSTLNPSSAPGPLASMNLVLLDTVLPSAPTS